MEGASQRRPLLTFSVQQAIFVSRLLSGAAAKEMKSLARKSQSRVNGKIPSRAELLAAHERSIQATDKMTSRESFEAVVRIGIINRKGQLTRRYGGKGKNQPCFR